MKYYCVYYGFLWKNRHYSVTSFLFLHFTEKKTHFCKVCNIRFSGQLNRHERTITHQQRVMRIESKGKSNYYLLIVQIQWPFFFLILWFPLINKYYKHQFVCIKSRTTLNFKGYRYMPFESTFKALKPDNFAFYLLLIASFSFDMWITQFYLVVFVKQENFCPLCLDLCS